MAKLNWFLTLRNLAKTDETAAQLMTQLKTAESDDDKERAKQQAQEYLQTLQPVEADDKAEDEVVPETDIVDSEEDKPVVLPVNDTPSQEDREEHVEEKPAVTDLSSPAFNPRLAKCGITREEELFLNGVCVRKMSREEKLLMRRAIYQKKTLRNARVQAEYKAKRIAQKEAAANNPDNQKYHQERKYVKAIVDALTNHCNWVDFRQHRRIER